MSFPRKRPLVRPLALAGDAVIEVAARVSIFVDHHRRRPVRRAILGASRRLEDVDETLALPTMDHSSAAVDRLEAAVDALRTVSASNAVVVASIDAAANALVRAATALEEVREDRL